MLPPGIQKGLKFLLENDLSNLALGRYEIEGNEIFADVKVECTTKPREQRRLESHFECVDIQYILSGAEMLGIAPIAAVGPVDEDRRPQKDAVYYNTASVESEILLSAGMFGVYFPWDVHRTQCSVDVNPGKVRKIVLKVAMKSLLTP
jgi:YhcH/YjgK/YiaL family protein